MIRVTYLHITFTATFKKIGKIFVKNVEDVGASLVKTMTSYKIAECLSDRPYKKFAGRVESIV